MLQSQVRFCTPTCQIIKAIAGPAAAKMAMLAAQVHSPEMYDVELQQAWHTLHSAAQRSSVRSECNDASMDGDQLDYVQYCQV